MVNDPQAIAQRTSYSDSKKWWNDWDCDLFYQVMIDRHGEHPIENYITVLSHDLSCSTALVQVVLVCI